MTFFKNVYSIVHPPLADSKCLLAATIRTSDSLEERVRHVWEKQTDLNNILKTNASLRMVQSVEKTRVQCGETVP